MKSSFFKFFMLFLATFSVSIFLYFYLSEGNFPSPIEISSERNEVTYDEYFVAQIAFRSLINDIKSENLINEKIATYPEDKSKIERMLSLDEIVEIDSADVYAWSKENNFDGVIIVPVEKADFRLKTLSIDDIFIWDEGTDISGYPLVYQTTEFVDKKDKNKYTNSNFDDSEIITYVAGGEVIPARAVDRKFRRTGDFTFAFKPWKNMFCEADVMSLILENSLSGSPEPCHGCVSFLGPEAFIEGLKYACVDIITPGNHFHDFGLGAIGRTIEVLDEAKISHTGFASTNWDDASDPTIYEVRDTKFAFLGYDDVAWYQWAGPSWGGVATVSRRESNGYKEILSDRIKTDVEKAKKVGDYVIVIFSWGDVQYTNDPLPYQEALAHEFLDAGADMIVGSHQHWVNAVEFYKGKPIFYGLGNFMFDLTHTDPTRRGVIVKFSFFKQNLVSAKIIPYQACGPQQSAVDDENCNHFQPVPLEEDDPVYKTIWDMMFEHSSI